MSSTQHTPAPWKQYANGNQVYGGDDFFITAVQSKNPEVDARLIAAAPELLEALERIALHCPSLDDVGIRAICDEAIAKATGGAS